MRSGYWLLILLWTVVLFAGCWQKANNDILDPDLEYNVLSLLSYDFQKDTTKIESRLDQADNIRIIEYIHNLDVTKIDKLELPDDLTEAYGIEFDYENHKVITLIGQYLLVDNGDMYEVLGADFQELYKEIADDERTLDQFFIRSHRMISLLEGHWDESYMQESVFEEKNSGDVQIEIGADLVSDARESLPFVMINSTDGHISFGSRYYLEVNLMGAWYSIDDMVQNLDGDLAWNDILHMLDRETEFEDTLYLGYYQPLPKGNYRVIKEYYDDKGNDGIAIGFFSVE